MVPGNRLWISRRSEPWSDHGSWPRARLSSRSRRPTDAARAGAAADGARRRSRRPSSCPSGRRRPSSRSTRTRWRALGAQILLGNTYHLHFRPGDELIRELGGLHRFMGWDGADPDRLRRLPGLLAARHDRARRRRRRHVPERLRRQRDAIHPRARRAHPGEPRQRHRHVPRPGSARPTSRVASWQTPCGGRREWATAQLDAPRADGQLRFGIAQGGTDRGAAPPLDGGDRGARIRRQRDRRARDRRGPRPDVRDDGLGHRARCPTAKPRYFMGIGDPEGILEVIEAGVDMFDCVLPTRTARTGSALTAHRPAQPAERPLRPRSGAARRALRLPGLHTVQPRLHPAPRQPGRGARPAAALAPQSTLRRRPDSRGARRRSSAVRSPRTNATSWRG